jgi:ethanolamine utilization protein EutS
MSKQSFRHDEITSRVIQEYVPGRQVTIAHVIANPDRDLCERVGIDGSSAVGIMTVTPGETAIIAADMAMKAAAVRIGFVDRFSGTLVICGELVGVEMAVTAANRGLETVLGFEPAPVTRS